MAVLIQSTGDMIDQYKEVTSHGVFVSVIEAMNDTSQYLLDDWTWIECNDGKTHLRGTRTGLPTPAWGALYEGIPQGKGSKQQVRDATGFVEGLAQIDTRQLELYDDLEAAVRDSEARPWIESMAQELMQAMFYHNSATNVRLPKGLAPRFSQLGTVGSSNQVVDGGGTGSNNTSIWMLTWGMDGVSALYPKGTIGGIQREDKGTQRVLDENGDPYFVKEEYFRAQCGFTVGDYRHIVRIANVDIDDVKAGTVDLYGLMRQGYYKLHGRRLNKVHDQNAPGRTVMYANKDICEALDALGTNAGATDNFMRLRPMEIQGKEVMSYRSMPIRETDTLVNTEARVV